MIIFFKKDNFIDYNILQHRLGVDKGKGQIQKREDAGWK
jgi:hypothetical protein